MTLGGAANPTPVNEACEGLISALEALNDEHTLGRYELLTPIGRGGMAVVWAARLRGRRGFSKIVAIKTMLPVLSSDPQFERMFLAEAAIVSRIKHPNVCEVLDLGEERGVLYLVMDWIDGEPLSSLLDGSESAPRSTVPYGVAAYLVAQAARGLHAAHELRDVDGRRYGLVHRDVSPQNILVTCDGAVKIVDFGVAKAARSEHVTESGVIKGKVAYLAPEQIEKTEIDARADVFALGAVLYEITTGMSPLRCATDLATLINIASPDPIARPEAPDYPGGLWKIVGRCLAKDRCERYSSMRELAADLEAFSTNAGAGIDQVTEHLTALLGERRRARARELGRAAREADERAQYHETSAKVASAKAPTVLAHEDASRGAEHGPRSNRRLSAVIGLVALTGVALGALGLRAADVAGQRDLDESMDANTQPSTSASAALVPATASSGTMAETSSPGSSPGGPASARSPASAARPSERAPVPSTRAGARDASPPPPALVVARGSADGLAAPTPPAPSTTNAEGGTEKPAPAKFRRPGF